MIKKIILLSGLISFTNNLEAMKRERSWDYDRPLKDLKKIKPIDESEAMEVETAEPDFDFIRTCFQQTCRL